MKQRSAGFTLLEVLIALGIVSVISILSWQGLQEVLRSAGRVISVDEQVQTVGAVFSQFEKDFNSLELALETATPASDLIEITGNGLLLQFTQRNTSEPAYRERVEWVLDGQNLVRVARNELNPEQASTSDPILTQGMQIRLLREPGGWSSPVTFGNPVIRERSDLDLQGQALQLNTGRLPAPAAEGEPPPTNPDTSQSEAGQGLVRAVEISLTQPNNQAVTRVFLTGGVY